MVELSEIRLMQLISPTLPTGGFSYSQGLEWAVEAAWVTDSDSLHRWLVAILSGSLCYVDIPLLRRMYHCCRKTSQENLTELERLCATLLACRESHEMQLEESNRGRAMATLLNGLGILNDDNWKKVLTKSQLAGICFGGAFWNIPVEKLAAGYLWAWLENQVLAGVKIIPLGQTKGQQLLAELAKTIPKTLETGFQLHFDEIGSSSPALALASSLHETQYTRIYRS